MRKFGRFLLWTAIVVGVLAVLLRVFLIKIWVVPNDDKLMSASIAPSLQGGDVVVLLHYGRPSFSDLARCIDPEEPRRFVIGRIAGEGGDSLVIEYSYLVVNGKRVAVEHACSPHTFPIEDPTSGNQVDIFCDVEDLAGHAHLRGVRPLDGAAPSPIDIKVQPGFVYLVSDNRSYPDDSRLYGALPADSCDARVIFRLWSEAGFFDVKNRFTWVR